ncbi:MAG: hypothetical protein WB630_09890 [Candidatus Acidiferrales bacterium]
MSDSYSPSSWQEPYQRALTETDEKKLTELIHATEGAMFLRWLELANSSDHRDEKSEMEAASAALLSIKMHKLGWPGFHGHKSSGATQSQPAPRRP